MNPRFLTPLAALAVVVSAAGCGGSVDNRPAKWSYIAPIIIEPNCATANCHSALTQRFNLRLDTIQSSYKGLHRLGSLLTSVLRGEIAGVQRMPPDAPLPDPDIALIEEWVANGAPWDGPGANPDPATTP
ncbi:MAG TPA: hypothetical protein VIU64_17325 [Polyangia bacterium]